MTAFRFACLAVAGWMLAIPVGAQERSLVQVASAFSVPDAFDGGRPGAKPIVHVVQHAQDASDTSWVLTDETIDSVPLMGMDANVPEVITGDCASCECGEKHCHGVCRDPGRPRKPWITKPGDRDRGDCPPLRYRMDDCERAGNPHCYHRWATCGIDGKYSAWFVGGGSPFCFGRSRTATEGTWGLDYSGWFGHTKTWLNYTRGRNQGGEGAYRTDGEPRIVTRAHELLHLGH